MATRRTYGDRCGIARALDLVGERWALLVVRELLLGPKRFTDLRAGLPHLSPNVLAQRLRELAQAGIVQRGKLPPPAASQIYELTDWGRQLEDVVISLGRWGARSPALPHEAGMSVDSYVIALKTLFDPVAADGLAVNIELRLGEDRYRMRVAEGRLEVTRGEAPAPDATIATDAATMAEVLWHDRPLAEAMRSGEIEIEGDRQAVRRFLGLFPLPDPVALPG